MKSQPGPPTRWGKAAAAHVRPIIWYRACGHQVGPDAAGMAERYSVDVVALDWREPLVCTKCDGRDIDMVVTETERQ